MFLLDYIAGQRNAGPQANKRAADVWLMPIRLCQPETKVRANTAVFVRSEDQILKTMVDRESSSGGL